MPRYKEPYLVDGKHVCPECKEPVDPEYWRVYGKVYCDKHAGVVKRRRWSLGFAHRQRAKDPLWKSKQMKAYRAKKRALGLCTRCGVRKTAEGFVTVCEECYSSFSRRSF